MPSSLWSRSEGDGPPVVFLHGWMMDHNDEAATYDAAFADRGYRRIYIDMPGMGESADSPVPHDLDAYADLLVTEIDLLTSGEPFLLSGTSAGALIACGVAARMPEKVRGLLLRVPLVHGPEDRRDLDPFAPLSNMPSDQEAGRTLPTDQAPLIADPIWTRDLYRKLRERVAPAMRRANLDAISPVRDDPVRYDLRRNLDRFERPALIVLARQDDNVGWRDAFSRFAHWSRASLALLDAASHEYPLDHQMPLMRALVDDWLHRLELAP
ncbi:alpha/beta fold hydrolase [Paracoccus albus]|uniref:alpha/beta fold hydrolase n=1 Tax=Paracoccus albus TaxID=3017784 RepID=UPI0022F1208E|nr:alpha/beta fold hydrolase [Paracoccus albus]WBU60148.1 alpha/beta fold hydrolase [Paracoccus albus]